MAGFSDYLEAELLDHVFGKGAYTPPTIYVGLFTAAPDDTGGGTECTGGSYARKSTAAGDWDAATGTAPCYIDNANAITFVQATASWGTVTHFGLFDAATAGNLLAWAALSASITVDSGETVQFAAGALVCQLD